MDGERLRGGSTITQQLVKNLFFGTGRSMLRKGAEHPRPRRRLVLGKQRILELYLNLVEWGPGIYGAERPPAHYLTPLPAASAASRPPNWPPFSPHPSNAAPST